MSTLLHTEIWASYGEFQRFLRVKPKVPQETALTGDALSEAGQHKA